MHRTRTFLVAMAAAAAACFAIAAPLTASAHRGWDRVIEAFDRMTNWLVSRLSKMTPDWLSAWRRVRAAGVAKIPMLWSALRRAQVSARWRMCPSV